MRQTIPQPPYKYATYASSLHSGHSYVESAYMYHPANIYTYSTYFLHNTTGENTHAHSNEFWEMVSLMLRNLKGSENSVI